MGLVREFFGVGVSRRHAGRVVTITEAGVVLAIARLEVAVLQLLLVARRDCPVGEAADRQGEDLLRQRAAGGGQGLGIGAAVGVAAGAFDVLTIGAELAAQFKGRRGGDDQVLLAVLADDAGDEAATVLGADGGDGWGYLRCCVHRCSCVQREGPVGPMKE
ncbi:hypothetical protein D9M70_475960 [compost metagenome]